MGDNQSHHSREKDETKPTTAYSPQRLFQHRTVTSIRSGIQSFIRFESGSDEAERSLNQEGSVKLFHGWMQSSIFSEPKPLIYTDRSGHFAICDETLMQISAITWKLVIVGIAGPYRCGKSFLMNRLAGKSKGFFVGNSTDAATKGIWAWCKVHPKQEETVLLLIDTEGLGDIKKGDKNHDNKLLTLITLLCNVLVFNMIGRFDDDSISKLSFATQISKWVKFGSDRSKPNNLPYVMPELILCLRDFFLEFRDGINTPDEYFEDCLKDFEGQLEYNAPRQSLKTFFPVRHCFTFPRPADDETMKHLEKADEKKLSKPFLQTADQFSQHIFNCEPKEMCDSALSVKSAINGSVFKGLLEYHIDCTKKGIIPDIEDAFFTASRKENEKIMQEIRDEFKQTINEIRLPVDSLKDLQDKAQTVLVKCLNTFRERMKLDKDNIQEKQLESDLQKMCDDKNTENSELLQKQFAENLMKDYRGNFKETKLTYAKENGYQEYKKELQRMKNVFEKRLDQSLQPEFTLAWTKFMNRIRDDEMLVLETDNKVTKEERERQMKELKDNHEKALQQLAKKQKDLLATTEKRLKKERDAKHAADLKKTKLWDRAKFLFTGKLGDN